MVRSGEGRGASGRPWSGPRFEFQPRPGARACLGVGVLGERVGCADVCSPAAPFQVLLHVLFEHAVGYALLALKEVEEISLLLPQVGGWDRPALPAAPQPLGRAPPGMHRALPRGRQRGEKVGGASLPCRWDPGSP